MLMKCVPNIERNVSRKISFYANLREKKNKIKIFAWN